MNKIAKLFLFLSLLASTCLSQQFTSMASGTTSATGIAIHFSLNSSQYTRYYLKSHVTGAPSTYQLQIESSTDHGNTYSVCGGAVTNQTVNQIQCDGTFTDIQLDITQLSGGSSPVVYYAIGFTSDTIVSINGSVDVNVINTPSININNTPSVTFASPQHVVVDSGSITTSGSETINDPCIDRQTDKNSVVISAATGSTTQIVGLTSGQRIYVCGGNIDAAGAGTVQLVTGTGTNCGSGQTNLTGNYSTALSTPIHIEEGINVPISQAVCAVVTGIAANINGVLIYIKR